MKIITLALATTLLGSALAQMEYYDRTNPFANVTGFYYDLVPFQAKESDKTRIDAFVQTPFNSIQFIRDGDVYRGEYSVFVSFYNEDEDETAMEKMWKERVTLEDFRKTNAKNQFALTVRSFALAPGDYTVAINVEDEESDNEYNNEVEYVVPDLRAPLSVSGLILVADKNVVDGKTRFIPNVTGNLARQDSAASLFYEVYSDIAEEATFVYTMKPKGGSVIYEDTVSRGLSKGKNQLFYDFDAKKASLGEYDFRVEIHRADGASAASERAFRSRWIGMPATQDDLELATKQMMYIAPSDEIDEILDADDFETQLERFQEFWKERDPSPSTAENETFNEYYRRVEYANKHFGNLREGWRSDMGMVYIVLGPPDNVERHPFEYDSKPYEIWSYYDINRRFIFVDQTGFGDYRLITPFYRENYLR
ncbi:MAG: GWxTD domain-containing protein [Ignavibacteriales bacterium]|nr:GWxTD domain-containing protein [Ignavibacteriales bacterium]